MSRVHGLLLVLFTAFLAACPGRFECDADTPCDFGSTCVAGQCEEVACATSAQCPIEHYCTKDRKCEPGCEDSNDCLAGHECDTEVQVCEEAGCEETNTDCGYKEYCNPATGECYEAGGDFCKPCEPDNDDCGSGNICWAGYCAVNCNGDRECPSGFECAPFVDDSGSIVTYQCITYCWLYEGYEPGSFAMPPSDVGKLPVDPDCDPADLLPPQSPVDLPEAP